MDRGVEYPGGNCVNVAVMSAELGADAAYLGVIGDDERGRFLLDAVAVEGVDVSHVLRRHGPTGLTEIETVGGDRVFLGWNEGGVTRSDPYSREELRSHDLDYVSDFDLVHSSVYSESVALLPALDELEVLRSFDLSSDPEYRSREFVAEVAAHADLIQLSLVADGEDGAVAAAESDGESLMRFAAEAGASLVLATRGSAGAVLFDGRETLEVPASPVPGTFVDTMACGDAFLSGFVFELLISGWRRGLTPHTEVLQRSLAVGADFAARQCTVHGAFGHGRRVVRDNADGPCGRIGGR